MGYHLTWRVSILCMCVISGARVTYLFAFHYYGVDAMRWGLKEINQDKGKYDRSMNICKGPTSLEEACNPAAMSSAESDNNISEWKNGIVTETDDSDDGSVKPSPPSGMWGLMQMLFIFGVGCIYWWFGLWFF